MLLDVGLCQRRILCYFPVWVGRRCILAGYELRLVMKNRNGEYEKYRVVLMHFFSCSIEFSNVIWRIGDR